MPRSKSWGSRLLERLLRRSHEHAVDIIVPVYGAREHTLRCIDSIRQHARGDWRLIIIDDASPDPGLVASLVDIAAQDPRILLNCQAQNSGFVRSANVGLELARDAGRDALLLNSDTLVTTSFLTKLADTVHAKSDTGIASPFTNNGTICSIPHFMQDNPLPPGLSVDEFAFLVASASSHRRPELVTAVGFCMYIRHDLLTQIGLFDEASFGMGYGEENDFCERAKKRGWRIRLCDDLFVFHAGRASFGAKGSEQENLHNELIGKIHPNYHRDVQKFIQDNPLSELHETILSQLQAHGIDIEH